MNDNNGDIFSFFDEFEASQSKASKSSSLDGIFDDQEIIPTSIDCLPELIQKEVLRRIKIITFVNRRLEGGWTEKNLSPILGKISEELGLQAPSWRILASWKKNYFESGQSIYSLIPKHANKGNRQKSLDSQRLVDEAIEKKYLTRERVSVAATYRYYKSRVIETNKNIVEGKIKPISKRSFYHRIDKLIPYDVACARFGKRYADREFRSVGEQIPATMPMEYVEIDHTPLPVILIDDALDIPLGRPHLTMLYDRFSKCIVGISVNFREPSFDSVRKALLNTMLDKSWLKQQYPSIKHDWPCHGKITYLVVDNGAEFWSQSLEDSLRPLVSDILYNQAAKPWRKAGIEKLFDQLNKGLNNSLPGKTFTNPSQLEGYDPKKDSAIRVSVFLELLHKWVVDYYHMSPDSRERSIPYQKWHQSAWTPNAYQEQEAATLRIELGLLRHRTINLAGIRLHNLRYQSTELIDYRKYAALNTKKALFVKTKTDPSDISFIYVYLETEKRYIKVPAVDMTGYTNGLSLFEHDRIQRVRRLNIRNQTDEESLADTYLYIERRIEEETDRFASRKDARKKKSLPKTGSVSKLAKYKDVGTHGPASIRSKPTQQPKTEVDTPIIDKRDFKDVFIDTDFSDIEGY